MTFAPEPPPPSTQPDPAALASAVYWRKNPFMAAMMVPLVMTLAGGRLTAVGPDGDAVFDAPASSVTGKLGRMGTFKIVVNGRKFAIVGRGSLGGAEKRHSEAQHRYVQEFLQRYPQAASVQRDAGAIDAFFNESAAAKLAVWRDALVAAGAAVR